MDIELDDKNKKLTGKETITYTNNSPDNLEFLWVQLDQNMRSRKSKTPLIQPTGVDRADPPQRFRLQPDRHTHHESTPASPRAS